ncbi:MAG: sugar transferase [Gemmatimonadaceae bacterium]
MKAHQPPPTLHKATAVRPATLPLGTATDQGRAVVVGLASDVPRALEHPAVGAERGIEVCGVVTVSGDDSRVRTDADSLHHLLSDHRATMVLVAGPLGPETMRAVADVALVHRCRLLAVMPSELVAGQDPTIVWEGASPLVQLAGAPRSSWQLAAKRFADAIGSAIGLAVLSPILLIIGAIIKIESRGPALFAHWRVGQNGRGFFCLKFRTMRADAEEILSGDAELLRLYRENHFKLPDHLDPRVTPFGRLLRRTSLDELPQLWNVLVGEMSLVGPRPVVELELEEYRGSERLLLSVRPGMTGAWAVNGRHHVGYPERAELELRYVRGWSLRRDAAILAGTIGAVMDPGSDVA